MKLIPELYVIRYKTVLHYESNNSIQFQGKIKNALRFS